MYKASLKIKTEDAKLFEPLDPPRYKRSRVATKKEKKKITFEIESDDAVALVATLGSIVKQLAVVSSVMSLVKKAAGKKGGSGASHMAASNHQ